MIFLGGVVAAACFCALVPPVFLCREALIVSPFSFFFFSVKADMLPVFFYIFARQGREMLGGTAVRNLQRQSESGSCLWMSVSLSPLLDAPEDILYEWCLPECFPLPGRQRCCIAADFQETCRLLFIFLFFFSCSFLLFHWLIHLKNVSFTILFQYYSHSSSWITLFWSRCEIWRALNVLFLDDAGGELN